MTTRRRIEITAFRRRTTIIFRDKPDVGPAEPSARCVDTSHPFAAEALQSEEAGLDKSEATQTAVAGQLLREAAPEPGLSQDNSTSSAIGGRVNRLPSDATYEEGC